MTQKGIFFETAMYELHYLRSLALTIFIETSLLFLIVRQFYKLPEAQLSRTLLLAGGILASGATLPYVWFVFPAFIQDHAFYTIAVESFATIAETGIFIVLFRMTWKKAFILSACCNTGSFIAGKLLT
ncbi:hypothetical protein U14_00415 [Candidatus Moduliflexus flocculans]|uniref:Uncharacterized protein n=1 Tax=Candidatus Moduliflexus flocculans TaxID=1499966 RepID=A0A0S6VPX1_9BACT|nr:hypothetical protein U14_00415 [Candidatus Moduliflexus flocculans]